MAAARPARRPARRVHARRAAIVAGSLVLLAAATGIAWWLWGRPAVPLPQPHGPAIATVSPRYLGSFGDTGAQHLVEPLGIAVAGDRVYVADAGARVVAVFDRDGKRVATLSGGGMKLPAYVAVDPRDGRVLVSDRQTGALLVFGADGRAIAPFDPKLPVDVAATGTVAPWRPLATAFAPDGTLYVTDTSREHRVVVFGPDGNYERVMTGASSGGMSYPNGVAAAGHDVVVADSNNARVLVFADDGSVKLEVKTGGLPRGVAVVASRQGAAVAEYLLVADTLGRKLGIWASDGSFVGEAGRPGSGGGEFSFPTDVSAGTDGIVYVTDTGNRRVQMWSLGPGLSGPAASAVPPASRPWWLVALAAAAIAAVVGGLAALATTVVSRRRARRTVADGADERREHASEGAERGPDKV
jgi:DNA-binding beta-propeller fold protein YncE